MSIARVVVSNVEKFDPCRVKPFKDQPRKRFKNIPELAESIRTVGQTNPGKVTLLDGDPEYDAMLVDGERRLEACKLAGMPFEAIVVSDPGNDNERYKVSFAANFGKQPHDCVEIAHGLKRLRDMGMTLKDVAAICSASIAWVSQHLLINELDDDVQQLLIHEESASDAQSKGEGEELVTRTTLPLTLVPLLVKLPKKVQGKIADRICNHGMSMIAAQRLILGKLHEHGIHIEHRERIRRMTPINRIMDQIDQRVGIYIDLVNNQKFDIVLEKMSVQERRSLVETINQVNDKISEIADAVEKSVERDEPKLKRPNGFVRPLVNPLASKFRTSEPVRPRPTPLRRGQW